MKRKFLFLTAALTASGLIAISQPAVAAATTSADFAVSQSTMVPGLTLKPGNYTIQVLDHLQDRFVLRIDGPGGSPHTIFIGVPVADLKTATSSGAVMWSVAPNRTAALRGFIFPKETGAIEFIYPKDDAVALAKANAQKVLAVDPASEGRSPQLSSLTNDEIQMVTLWTLTPQPVGPEPGAQPTLAATKYQAPNVEMASIPKSKPALKRLPHAAGTLPLLLLAGLFAILAATLLRIGRLNLSGAR